MVYCTVHSKYAKVYNQYELLLEAIPLEHHKFETLSL